MLAYSNQDVTALNARARADRLAMAAAAAVLAGKQAGQTGEKAGGREVTLSSGLQASAGDLIVTRRNDRRLGLTATDWVKNGDRFTIDAVHASGALSVRHHVTARTITLPVDFATEWVDLGYACTFHGAQDASVDTCHSALTGAENRQLFYVGMTRGRAENHAYVSTGGDGDEHAMIRPGSCERSGRSPASSNKRSASGVGISAPGGRPLASSMRALRVEGQR